MDAFDEDRLIEEIRAVVAQLNGRAFAARIDYWRRASHPAGGLAERVGGTRAAKLPAFDRTDAQINQAEVEYNLAVDGIAAHWSVRNLPMVLRCARDALKLEKQWLVEIKAASAEMQKELDRLASDAQSCNTCGDTKEAWVKRQRKRGVKVPLWRTRGGDCQACYQKKRRARLEELALIEPKIAAAS